MHSDTNPLKFTGCVCSIMKNSLGFRPSDVLSDFMGAVVDVETGEGVTVGEVIAVDLATENAETAYVNGQLTEGSIITGMYYVGGNGTKKAMTIELS